MADERPIDIMRREVRFARRALEEGTQRPLRVRDINNVVMHLRRIVWAYDAYRGKGAAKGRQAIVSVAEAIAELYFARAARERWERLEHLEFAGSMVADAYVAIYEMG